MIVVVILLLLAALWLLAIRPNPGRGERLRPFTETYIAHRGLHHNPDMPENSLPAFARAAEAGFGIELDVQLTADDQLVVFHDETLERVCGDPRKLHELTYAELRQLRLFGTDERIPLFRDVLELVGGRAPLLVEIKSEGRYLTTTRRTDELLRSYPGIYIVESFHPMVLRWLRKNSPDTVRGQLATDFRREKVALPEAQRFLLTNLLLNFLSRPDFIAYDRQYRRQPSFRLCRALFRPVCFAWTVRSQAQLDEGRDAFQAFIFEGFAPADDAQETNDKKRGDEL